MYTSKAQTNVYHPFPDSNAVWNFHFHASCPFGMSADYSIMISSDTVFNNINYKKLYTPHIQLAFGSSPCYFIDSNYRGAIRQDTSIRKVYIVPKYDSTEVLYFDFNSQVGDTVSEFLCTFLGMNMNDTINLIDSVLIGNSYRKRWYFNDCYPTSVIEGIGAIYGFIEPSAGCVTDQPYINLTCFKQDNQILYHGTATACDLIIVNVDEINTGYQIKIYPNPVKDEINFDFGDLKINKLKIYNMYGQLIVSQNLNNNNKIKTENLSAGSYFLSLTDKKGNIYNKKIIIQK